MNLRSLKLFRQIILTGSLSEASKKLYMSTSAASRLITILEHEVSLKLFSRRKRKLELTEEGDLFYRSIANTLDGLEAIPTVSEDIRNRSTNWLSVVTSAPLSSSLVSPALAQIKRQTRNFQCSLNVEARFNIESQIAARGYNLGIISLPVENAILNLSIEPFLKARIEVMLHKDHALAHQEQITLEELQSEIFVSLKPHQRWRQRLEEILGAAGSQINIPFETSSTVATMQMIRDGLGISIIDRANARLTQDDTAVIRPLVEERWITYAILYAPGPRTPLSRDFLTAITTHVEQLRAASSHAAASLQLI